MSDFIPIVSGLLERVITPRQHPFGRKGGRGVNTDCSTPGAGF
jgi:hypothetical protein